MKKLHFSTGNKITSHTIRYLLATVVLFVVFWFYPMRSKLQVSQPFSTTFFAGSIPLTFIPIEKNKQNGIPLLAMDSEIVEVFDYTIRREDPNLMHENDLFSGHPLENFRGVSARNLNIGIGGGGGSTIAQQALKCGANKTMLRDYTQRTIASKLGEISASIKLTGNFSSNQVLQLYANEISCLNAAHRGVILNCLSYFNVRDIKELNDYERYLLARSLKAVISKGFDFRKLRNWKRADIDSVVASSFRTTLIKNNKATEADLAAMLKLPLRFRKKSLNLYNPYLIDLVTKLPDSLRSEGMQYLSALNPSVITAIDSAFIKYSKNNPLVLQAGNALLDANAIVIDLASGEIIGINSQPLCNPRTGNLRLPNHILTPKSPASTIKPMLIAEGFKQHLFNDQTLLLDQRRGRLHNYHEYYRGAITISDAIKYSSNVAINNYPQKQKLIDGLEKDFQDCYKTEINGLPKNYNPSMYCIGEPRQLNIIQIGQVYRAMITNGYLVKSRIFEAILNTNVYPFDTVYSNHASSIRLFPEEVCSKMRNILKAPLTKGGTLHGIYDMIKNKEHVIGKSGTSDNYSTGWTVLADNRYLVVVSIMYWSIRKGSIDKVPIPTKTGGGSAGIIAATILNQIQTYYDEPTSKKTR